MQNINYLPNAQFECFKILGTAAYFQNEGLVYKFNFDSIEELETWKNARSIENRKLNFVEDYQACDDNGNFQYLKFYRIYKSMGVIPDVPNCLTGIMAMDEVSGIETDLEDVEDRISPRPDRLRPIPGNVLQFGSTRKQKIKQLTDRHSVSDLMGELFLSEIKLSTDQANAHLRNEAALIGLMEHSGNIRELNETTKAKRQS